MFAAALCFFCCRVCLFLILGVCFMSVDPLRLILARLVGYRFADGRCSCAFMFEQCVHTPCTSHPSFRFDEYVYHLLLFSFCTSKRHALV